MDARRSGWLTYAAVMMFIAAGLYALWAINLWADAAWLAGKTERAQFRSEIVQENQLAGRARKRRRVFVGSRVVPHVAEKALQDIRHG